MTETQKETLTINTLYNGLTNSLETLKNIIDFIKQYFEITHGYHEKLRILYDKFKLKFSSINSNQYFSSSHLVNKIMSIIKYQFECSEDTDISDSLNEDFLEIENNILETRKEVDNYTFGKDKLIEKQTEIEKAKAYFYKEAKNVETKIKKVQLQKKKHLSKLSTSYMPLDKRDNRSLTFSVQIPTTPHRESHETLSLKKFYGQSNYKNDFSKVKKLENKYISNVTEYTKSLNEFEEKTKNLTNSILSLNQDCKGHILQRINSFLLCINKKNKNFVDEMIKFFDEYPEIENSNTKIDTTLQNSVSSINNDIIKVKVEPYSLTMIKDYVPNKQKIYDEYEMIEMISCLSNEFLVKGNEKITSINNDEQLDFLIKKLLSNNYIFFPLTSEDKKVLYKALSDAKNRFLFFKYINSISSSPSEAVPFINQFIEMCNIMSFIITISYQHNDFSSISNALSVSKRFYKLYETNGSTRIILQKIKKLPLFQFKTFWYFVFEHSILNIINEGLLTIEKVEEKLLDEYSNVKDSLSEKFKDLNNIMSILEVNKEIVKDVILESLFPFHLSENFIKEMYNVYGNQYKIFPELKENEKDIDEEMRLKEIKEKTNRI